MNNGVFLDASILENREVEEAVKFDIQQNRILFEFPEGFCKLRLIEECRALNALDVSQPDNFDLIYDITMQMITGKPVFIYYISDDGEKHLIERFLCTDRYMNLRGVTLIDSYPIIVNWLVEFVAGFLGKKFPLSLENILEIVGEKKDEPLKNQKKAKKNQEV